MKTWLTEAREASGLTPEDCASALKCSRPTYMSREKLPGSLTIVEVSALTKVMNEKGRKVVHDALAEMRL